MFSTEQLVKNLFYGGFDSYEDYVKYGDMFIRIEPYRTIKEQIEDIHELYPEIKAAMEIYEECI